MSSVNVSLTKHSRMAMPWADMERIHKDMIIKGHESLGSSIISSASNTGYDTWVWGLSKLYY